MSDCYWEDEGGFYADMDYEAQLQIEMSEEEYEEHLKNEKLNILRNQRLLKQKGKFLIQAKKNGKIIYLQDQRISNGGYWTQFKSNARVFSDKIEAQNLAKTFKYNNPVVING